MLSRYWRFRPNTRKAEQLRSFPVLQTCVNSKGRNWSYVLKFFTYVAAANQLNHVVCRAVLINIHRCVWGFRERLEHFRSHSFTKNLTFPHKWFFTHTSKTQNKTPHCDIWSKLCENESTVCREPKRASVTLHEVGSIAVKTIHLPRLSRLKKTVVLTESALLPGRRCMYDVLQHLVV